VPGLSWYGPSLLVCSRLVLAVLVSTVHFVCVSRITGHRPRTPRVITLLMCFQGLVICGIPCLASGDLVDYYPGSPLPDSACGLACLVGCTCLEPVRETPSTVSTSLGDGKHDCNYLMNAMRAVLVFNSMWKPNCRCSRDRSPTRMLPHDTIRAVLVFNTLWKPDCRCSRDTLQ
jgi:hypothetical protein